MKALAVAAALAALASAAPKPASTGAGARRPQGARAGEPYWFKTYTTAPYSEIWTGDLALKDFPGDLPKVVQAIEANGGALTQPLANLVSSAKDQQLTFALPRRSAKALLKSLRALGDLPEPATRAVGAPIPVDEVRAKIAVVMKEKTERAAELARVPAAAAAQEEILEHLEMVEELAERVEVEIRFNLQVRRK